MSVSSVLVRSLSLTLRRALVDRFLTIGLPALLGFFILFMADSRLAYAISETYNFPPFFIEALGILFVTVALAGVVMAHLQTGLFPDPEEVDPMVFGGLAMSRTGSNPSLEYEIDRIGTQVRQLRAEIGRIKPNLEPITDSDREALVVRLMEEARSGAAQSLVAEIETRLQEEARARAPMRLVNGIFNENLQRLATETSALGRRGNLNLLLGVMTTISGLILLGYFVLYDRVYPTDPVEFGVHFVPRIALVLFVQAFAYFFLRLYKSSLQEIKFFQNETTNIQQRQAALIASIELGEQETQKDVILTLARTDRNRILAAELGREDAGEDKKRDGLIDIAKQLIKRIPQGSSE